MKRTIASLALLASMALPATAAAQTSPQGCQFILGFKTLHDLAPAEIGDCTDNQAYAGNGDAQQHTTKGLMAWRKVDNWTAFTNGYMTWINGPKGLVSRLNADRFDWEKDSAGSAAPSPAPAPAPSGPPSTNLSGGWRLVQNQAVYSFNQDQDGFVIISPNQMRQCTSSGQSIIPNDVNINGVKSAMNQVFTGTFAGNVLSGDWLVCATGTQAWLPKHIQFTLSPDGRHLTGQLDDTITFDRL
jgi:hypothetical protein